MFRRRPRQQDPLAQLDLGTLEPRWRAAVEEALASRVRFRSLVEQSPGGPLRDRLEELAASVDIGVHAAVDTAFRAQAAAQTLRGMDLEHVTAQLKDARRRLARATETGAGTQALSAEVDLLLEQHAALNDLANSVDEAGDRLRMLDLRLDASVARAAQMVLRPDALQQLGMVDQELRSLVEELGALQSGLAALPRSPGS
jgi:hypothetical protein